MRALSLQSCRESGDAVSVMTRFHMFLLERARWVLQLVSFGHFHAIVQHMSRDYTKWATIPRLMHSEKNLFTSYLPGIEPDKLCYINGLTEVRLCVLISFHNCRHACPSLSLSGMKREWEPNYSERKKGARDNLMATLKKKHLSQSKQLLGLCTDS